LFIVFSNKNDQNETELNLFESAIETAIPLMKFQDMHQAPGKNLQLLDSVCGTEKLRGQWTNNNSLFLQKSASFSGLGSDKPSLASHTPT